jgi:hypothetical protein
MLPAVLVLLVAASPADPAAASALDRGDALHAAFDYEGARREYEQALAVEPESAVTRLRLAHALNDLAGEGRGPKALVERALRLSDEALAAEPELARAHYWRAASLANLIPFRPGPEKVRLSRQLEAAAQRATELDPRLAPAYAVLGIMYRELAGVSGFVRGIASVALGGLPKGSLLDADGLLRAAVVLDPEDPFFRYQLALTLEARGLEEDAAAELERSLALAERELRDRRNRSDAEARLARRRGAADGAGTR